MILAQSSPSHPLTKDPDPLRDSYLELASLITTKCVFLTTEYSTYDFDVVLQFPLSRILRTIHWSYWL